MKNGILLPQPDTSAEVEWPRLYGGARALALLQLAAEHPAPLLVIEPDPQKAWQLEQDLELFNPDHTFPILHFPDWEILPYDVFSPHPDIISSRLSILSRLPGLKQGIVIIAASTLMQKLPPQQYIQAHSLQLACGDACNLDEMRQRLDAAGYQYVSQVNESGEFTLRGSLMDLFPMGSTLPYRIELFDDEIETIRSFDPENQRSLEKTNQISLLPGREFPFTENAAATFRDRFRQRFDIDPRRCPLYRDVRNMIPPAGIEFYLPLFFDESSRFQDYFSTEPCWVLEEDIADRMTAFQAQCEDRYEQRCHDVERPILKPGELYADAGQLLEEINHKSRIRLSGPENQAICKPAPSLPIHSKGEDPGKQLRNYLASNPEKILIAADSPGRREALADTLSGLDIKTRPLPDWHAFVAGDQSPALISLPLSDGFSLPGMGITVLTEAQLFGERVVQQRSKRQSRDPANLIKDLTDLQEGSPVVHEAHGVGRYLGLQSLQVGEHTAEFLTIAYAGEDKLYVPVADLHLISRYTGASPETAPLHKLGGEQWARVKRKAAEKIRDVAAELLDIYAQREARSGTSTRVDRKLMEDFAATFPFEETEDQQQAIQAVLQDLQSPKSMDRVVCGDVGFGKTEVAMRAAFAVASSGAQVAVLVPTTLLAQQHYRNFADRFADWPLKVELMSRFRASSESSGIQKQLSDGSVDVVIGTHKLLQHGIRFKNLGLVIIDEEQRFGVQQKEKLKALRAEVDLLTLTATPIPRTLNMALSGLRDLSIIATPPKRRMAVKTFISEWDDAMLKDAVQRELQRGGQVFFLHNEVKTIERMAEQIKVLFPYASIRIGHGQMPEKTLEQVMLDFRRQRFNILLATTIIENGIDIPNANTIIINRADRFGLAQLHQLRGRVGRSHHRAYAYLLTPETRAMTADARKRLEAIAALEDLGAGFNLATHDLEIRGAGELLGEEQSGQINEIGFSMYMELLERAVKAIREGKTPDLEQPLHPENDVSLHMPALIPEDYLPDVHTRLTLYKRIASCENSEELDTLQVEMIDRFGLLPSACKNLFRIAHIKQMCSGIGIERLEAGEHGGRIHFASDTKVNPGVVIELVQKQSTIFSFDGQDKLRFKLELEEEEERLLYVSRLIESLEPA